MKYRQFLALDIVFRNYSYTLLSQFLLNPGLSQLSTFSHCICLHTVVNIYFI